MIHTTDEEKRKMTTTQQNNNGLLHKLYHAAKTTATEGKALVKESLEGAFYDCQDVLDRRVAESPVLVGVVDGFAAALTSSSPHRSEDKDYRRSSWVGRAIGYSCAPGIYLTGGIASRTVSAASNLVAKGEGLVDRMLRKA